MQILIVEDEERLADALGQIMAEKKYLADVVCDGQDGIDYGLSGRYDVIVLDVMLPKKSGFEVVKALRAAGIGTPVIMLTARDDVRDKVMGLDCGADDYMTKPFAPEELLARIRALTRRQGEVVLEEMKFGDLTLALGTNDLSCGEKSVRLSFKESEILKILIANAKGTVPKETLITKVWGCDSDAEDNNVEAYISFLRKKLHYVGSKAAIETIRKVGYHLHDQEAAQ